MYEFIDLLASAPPIAAFLAFAVYVPLEWAWDRLGRALRRWRHRRAAELRRRVMAAWAERVLAEEWEAACAPTWRPGQI